MEHIEEAGIHSGDSACALPPITLGATDVAAVRHATGELAARIGVRGLLNVQYALKDGVLSVLEANPRASRTVPFVSKATAVPLAKAAARIALGATVDQLRTEGLLPATGDGGDLPPDAPVAVKEAVLPFHRFRRTDGSGVDTVLGPEMRSTGEVMGLDAAFGTAFAKSQAAAYGSLPTGGTAFVSIANRDKRAAILPIMRLADLGFRILATEGTALALRRHGVPVEVVRALPAGHARAARLRAADPGRRGRPGVQHAVGVAGQLRPAAGRVRDPHRRGRGRDPVRDHGAGHDRVRAGGRGAAAGGPGRALAAGAARRSCGRGTGDGGVVGAGGAGRGAARAGPGPRRGAGPPPGRRLPPGRDRGRRDRRAVPAGPVRRAVGRRAGLGAAAAPVVRGLPGHPGRRVLAAPCRSSSACTAAAPSGWPGSGRASRWTSSVRSGTPFRLPAAPTGCLLVGGGYGSAPLFSLADALRARECRVDFLLGAGSQDRVFGELEAKRTAGAVAVCTDDGSLGRRGTVADALPDEIERTGAAAVYACGPMAMLRAVGAVAASYGLPCQVAVEESMACGIGVCMTCVLPVVGEDGVTRMSRSCVDGPVFDARPGALGRRRHGAGGRGRAGGDLVTLATSAR